MSFKYEPSPEVGALIQGEILYGVHEFVADVPAQALSQDLEIIFNIIEHNLVMVMNPGCDLEWDYVSRFTGPQKLQNELAQVFLCEVYEEVEIKSRSDLNSSLFRNVKSNQNERYHHLQEASIANSDQVRPLPDLYMDFKNVFGIATLNIYRAIEEGGIDRIAVVPPVYVQHLMQRFYNFRGRIGLLD